MESQHRAQMQHLTQQLATRQQATGAASTQADEQLILINQQIQEQAKAHDEKQKYMMYGIEKALEVIHNKDQQIQHASELIKKERDERRDELQRLRRTPRKMTNASKPLSMNSGCFKQSSISKMLQRRVHPVRFRDKVQHYLMEVLRNAA